MWYYFINFCKCGNEKESIENPALYRTSKLKIF